MPINTDVNYSALIRMTRQSILAMFGHQASKDDIPSIQAQMGDYQPGWVMALQMLLVDRIANQEANPLVLPYMQQKQYFIVEDEPFSDFALDPAPISQIKKIVNALYHAEKILKSTNNGVQIDIYNNTNQLYTLCRLLTDTDVDLTVIFGDEIALLTQMLESVNNLPLIPSLPDLSYQAGEYTGMAVNYLKPHKKGVNNTFIVEFTLALPTYLNCLKVNLSNTLNANSNKKQDGLCSKEILQQFDDVVIQGVPLAHNKIYIHFIRPALALQSNILDEIQAIQDLSYKSVFAQLRDLKIIYLPRIIAFADKIEEEMLLKPGVLSAPLLAIVDESYALLVRYAQYSSVDFSDHGELLSLHHTQFAKSDSQFIEARLSASYQRWAERDIESTALEAVMCAQESFFAIINRFSHKRLSQLPHDLKQELIAHYAVIQPHLAEIDIKLSNIIVQSLLATMDVDHLGNYLFDIIAPPMNNGLMFLDSFFTQDWRLRLDYPDSIQKILEIRRPLENRLNKLIATHRFYQDLNVSIIKHVYQSMGNERTDLSLTIGDKCVMIAAELRAIRSVTSPPATISLAQDKQAEARATRIVKQPVYSAAVTDLRKQFATFFEHLSPAMQYALQPRTSQSVRDISYSYLLLESKSIPYPELEQTAFMARANQTGILSQPQQVLGLKRLANCLYHLEEASIQFELLDTQSRKFLYVRRVFTIQHHVAHASLHLIALATDPYLSPAVCEFIEMMHKVLDGLKVLRRDFKPAIGWDLLLITADSLLQLPILSKNKPTLIKIGPEYYIHGNTEGKTWELTKLDALAIEPLGLNFAQNDVLPYNLKFDDLYIEIATKKAHIHGAHDAVFYTIAAFSVLPEHLKMLNNRRMGVALDITSKAHQKAKELSIHINRIISKTNRYISLFLETGTAIYVMQELKRCLSTFSITANSVTWKNLEAINIELLTPLLLEADRWEDKFGLPPGEITYPLEQILDAYYQALLESIQLPHTQHRILATTLLPINMRIGACAVREHLAELDLAELEKQYQTLSTFIALNSNNIEWTAKGPRPRHIAIAFQALLPLIMNLKTPCERAYLEICNYEEDELALLLHDMQTGAMFDKARRGQVEKIIDVCDAYLVGMMASAQLTRENASAKLDHLRSKKQSQENINYAMIEAYANASIDIQLASFKGIHGITYDTALSAYIEESKTQITDDINPKEDIEQYVKSALAEKMLHFEVEQGVDCRQFEAIKQAMAQLKRYIDTQQQEIAESHNKSAVFESNKTLAEKRAILEKLEQLMGQKDISACIRSIHAEIKKPEFKTTMLRYDHENLSTFEWLCQCVNAFFELINLYTSERKACYLALAKASQPVLQKASLSFFQPPPQPSSDVDCENDSTRRVGLGPTG